MKLELNNSSCNLTAFGYQLALSAQNIRINDGIRHGLAPFPIGEFSAWESVKLRKFKNRILLELKVWSHPKSEASVESLRWVIVELKGSQAETRLNQIIRKRRPNLDAPGQYIYDPMVKHKITVEKQGKLVWVSGRHSGRF